MLQKALTIAKSALITTAVVIVGIWALKQFSVTKTLVDNALDGVMPWQKG